LPLDRSPPGELFSNRVDESKSLIYATPKKKDFKSTKCWASSSWASPECETDSPFNPPNMKLEEGIIPTILFPLAQKIRFESDLNEKENTFSEKKLFSNFVNDTKTLNEWLEVFSILASSEIKKNIVVQAKKNGFLHLNHFEKNKKKPTITGPDGKVRNLYDIRQFYIILDCLFNQIDEIWKNCNSGVVLKTISYKNYITEIEKNDPVVYCKMKVEEFEAFFSEFTEFLNTL
jgi:hypothetical protein